ncbi:hypothetical protein NECID01_0226 [Nematocida sp. AWRm77]|nr:hypothetical protein NECID01_0226 [Nematocida sp. AWRm77]
MSAGSYNDELGALFEEYNQEQNCSEEDSLDEYDNGTATDEEEMEDELMRLEELNQEKTEKKEAPKETPRELIWLLSALHREGTKGFVHPEEHVFLSPFMEGLDSAWAEIKEETSAVLKQAEEEVKGPLYKKLNKQKPIKQRVKQAVAEKTKKMAEGYEDILFVQNLTKDFGYKTGIRIHTKKSPKEKSQKKEKNPLYEAMKGFYTPAQGPAWEDEKITEFVACVFSG